MVSIFRSLSVVSFLISISRSFLNFICSSCSSSVCNWEFRLYVYRGYILEFEVYPLLKFELTLGRMFLLFIVEFFPSRGVLDL